VNLWELVKGSVNDSVDSPRKAGEKLEGYAAAMKEQKDRRIAEREYRGRVFFIGDIHGDLETLSKMLSRIEVSSLEREEAFLVFLGDYIDRGPRQLESLFTALEVWSLYPRSVVVLRGNHEPLSSVSPYPHDFPEELVMRFGYEKGSELYWKARELFELLPMASIINGEIAAVHGGIPTLTYQRSESVLEYLSGRDDEDKLKVSVELLWNDPTDDPVVRLPSPRGAGYLWGPKVTEWARKKFGLKQIVRGHEACDMGYKFNHGGAVLTLFSRTGPPYFNRSAAYAVLDLSREDWTESILSSIFFIIAS